MTDTIFEDEFSEEVWRSTYKDSTDNNVDDTMMRVARGVAQAEKNQSLRDEWQQKFYDMLTGFKVTAGGRIYSNAGADWGGTTLMNCFLAPRATHDIDSLENIMTNLRNQSQTLKSEGGWGENFSYIRPRGSFIHGIGVESPGAVKYMELFDRSSDIITSGSGKKSTNKKAKGKIRKGAMMGVIDVTHPDIVEFITAKQSAGRLSKFNVSVNMTDDFMEKIIKIEQMVNEGATQDEIDLVDQWQLRFPDTTHEKYKAEWDGDLALWVSKEYPVDVFETVSALKIWNLVMDSTYNRAEPGVLFLDRANYFYPTNYVDKIVGTNPCGEQTLPPAGVCDLGSVNLAAYIKEKDGVVTFDYKAFKDIIPTVVRFLDNINDVSNAPLPEYEDSMRNKRRIGVGILGWGSLLFMMKIRFGSDAANELRDEIMKTLAQETYKASIDLAVEKGMFKYCKPEEHVKGPFVQSLDLPKSYMEKLTTTGIRNSSCLSIQPTGNTSIFANILSGGNEPIFMPEYIRTVIQGIVPDHLVDLTPKWYEGQWFETDMFKFDREGDEEILKGVDETTGIVYKIDKNRGLTKEVLCEDYAVRWLKARGEWNPDADWAVTTEDLTADDHVNDLKGFARWIDSAISKTVNIPHDYPYEDFKDIYLNSYKSGWIKGVTTYRSGTMTSVLSAKEDVDTEEEIIIDDVKMPDSAPAVMKTIRAEGKKWYLTIVYNETDNRPFALFVKTNSRETSIVTNNAIELLMDLVQDKGIKQEHIDEVMKKINGDDNASKITRIISFLLRHGVLIKNIVRVLDRIEDVYVGSFIFQIKKFLQTYIKDGEKVDGEKCEECGSDQVVYSEGCFKCNQCGSSKCG